MVESAEFARQMIVITVVITIICAIVWSVENNISRGFTAFFHGRAHLACVWQMFLDWFHQSRSLDIPLTAEDDSLSRDVFHVAARDGCYVCYRRTVVTHVMCSGSADCQ